MKVLIIEDELPIAQAFEKLLKSIRPTVEIIGVTTDIADSITAIENNPDLDIIFSDIKIDDGLSFSVFDSIDTRALIVFTTAYDDYALKAFDYQCIDYLLKPISPDALERAICRYEQRFPHIDTGVIRSTAEEIINERINYRNRLFLFRGKDRLIVPVKDVCFFFSEKGDTRVFLTDGSWAGLDKSLIEVSQSLDPVSFCRINRQAIVNVNYISTLSPGPGRDSTVTMRPPFSTRQFRITADRKKILLPLLR